MDVSNDQLIFKIKSRLSRSFKIKPFIIVLYLGIMPKCAKSTRTINKGSTIPVSAASMHA